MIGARFHRAVADLVVDLADAGTGRITNRRAVRRRVPERAAAALDAGRAACQRTSGDHASRGAAERRRRRIGPADGGQFRMNSGSQSAGQALFAQYAYPPNELGYCGPDGRRRRRSGLAAHAKEFDGAWPYLAAIAEAVGASDPLDEDVVGSYWVGGPPLAEVDPASPAGSTADIVQGTGHRAARCGSRGRRGVGTPQLSRLRGLPVGAVSWTAIRRPRSASCRTAASAGEPSNRSRVSTR